MAEDELTFPDPEQWAAESTAKAQAEGRFRWKHELRAAVVPYGVDLETQTFYFGPEEPTEDDWEIKGEWVETQDGPAISRFELLASARVFTDGEPVLRPADSVPGTGADRDLLRKYGSKYKILRAIIRERNSAEAWLREHSDSEQDIPPWGMDIIQQNEATRSVHPAIGKPLEWWVRRADEYLALARKLGTKYGVQEQLADKTTKDYWGVGISGTRYRARKLRELGLIDESGPIPQPGKNHPHRRKR